MSSQRSIVLLSCLFVFTEASLKGQGLTGQISGSVHDPSGSPVVAAAVALVNQGTGAARQLTSDQSGTFLFAQLLAGNYTLTISAPGFKKHEEKDIVLSS
jgi:hypothetical protein